jgi:hypothetical protein
MLLALLPWWRNHGYLRDLYDYGIVLSANGRIDAGERPYVDFTTPIQAGFLGLNWLVEKIGGHTYTAVTVGGAALIAASMLLLAGLLARRWPWWAAATVALAVTVSGPSQHTILWHNALGVFCLALVTWAAACAPVLRREDRGWHAVLALGLVLGGINKLNFHLVGVAGAAAWALRAGLLGRASWRRVLFTLAALGFMGLALPVGLELLWTGASPALWFHNVVQLAVGSRLETLHAIVSGKFLFHPIHDYYGPLPLPQLGLAGLLLCLLAVIGGWPGAARGWLDRGLLLAAALLAGAGGAALLATNFEIGCLGLGSWLVLAVSLWLGFAPPERPVRLAVALVLPAAVIAATAWRPAWQGQRSQFGYSTAARADYVAADSTGPALKTLAGLKLPPEFAYSLELLGQSLPDPGPDGRRPVFYGLGTEWLERYYPAVRRQGQPLWIHWGTSYTAAEKAELADILREGMLYEAVVCTIARDEWPDSIRAILNRDYLVDLVGPVVRRWTFRGENSVNLADPFEAQRAFGGNLDSRSLHFDRFPMRACRLTDGRFVLGSSREVGQALLTRPGYRMQGRVVLQRLARAGDGPLTADFKIIVHGASPENVRWSAHVELPAGRQTAELPLSFDSGGQPLLLWVTQPAGQAGRLFAGYRELEILHAVEAADGAPRLRDGLPADVPVTPELADSLFGGLAGRPARLTVRGGEPGAAGLQLSPGGEAWFPAEGIAGAVQGRMRMAPGTGRPPFVRVLWCKGGRLQILQQAWLQRGQEYAFRAWAAEPGGWIGVVVSPGDGQAPVEVRLTEAAFNR